jgi:hypothetical protein
MNNTTEDGRMRLHRIGRVAVPSLESSTCDLLDRLLGEGQA